MLAGKGIEEVMVMMEVGGVKSAVRVVLTWRTRESAGRERISRSQAGVVILVVRTENDAVGEGQEVVGARVWDILGVDGVVCESILIVKVGRCEEYCL